LATPARSATTQELDEAAVLGVEGPVGAEAGDQEAGRRLLPLARDRRHRRLARQSRKALLHVVDDAKAASGQHGLRRPWLRWRTADLELSGASAETGVEAARARQAARLPPASKRKSA